MFNMHRYGIFRNNPRGPLGSVGVNRQIRATLVDENKRPTFHLLNNGLSAVCDAFRDPVRENGTVKLHVEDFQIVNGCQTTYNIWDHWRRGGSLRDTKVVLKLVEGQNLRRFISEASNAQSQMKDWDFLFNDPIQERLQKEFEMLRPQVFYELRRGEHKYIAHSYAHRITIKDVAQTTWAFLGFPGEAKDRLREIPRSRLKSEGPYHDVFFPNVTASYLYLPWLTYEKVREEHRNYVEQTGERGDYREHGRLYILWLRGRGLTEVAGKASYREFGPKYASTLVENIGNWFHELHRIALETLSDVVDVQAQAAEITGQQLSLRQLFRSSSHYHLFEKVHDRKMTQSRDLPTLAGVT